jgi:acyl-CoA reductase-like NAD-dependent aldehyde dehydrogenase
MAIQRSAAEVAVKSISLELGGKNPFIVFPDAPVEKVAEAAVAGMNFIWQGQSCSSTSRLFVHDSIYDEVVQRVIAKAEAIRIGDPFEWTTQMGAINSQAHLSKIEDYVEIGKAEGRGWSQAGNGRLALASRRAAGSSPPCSLMSGTICASPARRSSAPYSQSCVGPMSMMRSRWPIRSSTG